MEKKTKEIRDKEKPSNSFYVSEFGLRVDAKSPQEAYEVAKQRSETKNI